MTDIGAVFPQLIDHVSTGKTQASFLRVHQITHARLFRWLEAHPTERTALVRARELGAHAMADDAVDIADDETINPHRARNQIEIRKWHAGVTAPKTFGPKMDLHVTQQIDIGGALIDARKRALQPASNPQQIADAQVIEHVALSRLAPSDNESLAADSGQADASALDVFK